MTITTLDFANMISSQDFHIQLAKALQLPKYYGSNLDAMVDCLRDILDQNSSKTSQFKLTIRMINLSKLLDSEHSKASSELDFMNILSALSLVKTEYPDSFEVIVEL